MTDTVTDRAIDLLAAPDLTIRAQALGTLVGQGLAQALASPPASVPPGTLTFDAWFFSVMGVAARALQDAEAEWIAAGHTADDASAARFAASVAAMAQVRIGDITASATGAAN